MPSTVYRERPPREGGSPRPVIRGTLARGPAPGGGGCTLKPALSLPAGSDRLITGEPLPHADPRRSALAVIRLLPSERAPGLLSCGISRPQGDTGPLTSKMSQLPHEKALL